MEENGIVKPEKSGEKSVEGKCDSGTCHTPRVRVAGFDAVVEKERLARLGKFGPNSTKIPKPNTIIIDIYGVISPWSFTKKLITFAQESIEQHVIKNWNSKIIKLCVGKLNDQIALERRNGIHNIPDIAPAGSPEDVMAKSVGQCLKKLLEKKEPSMKSQLDAICRELWSQSYEDGSLKVDAYPDVQDSFQYWRYEQFIKIYTYASGHVDGQRQYLKSTTSGNLNRYIANCIDASGGYKFDATKFRSLLMALREVEPKNLLYFTDDPRKARSAMETGMRTIVVNRDNQNTGKYSPELVDGLTMIKSLSDVQFIDNPNGTISCC